MIMLNIKRLVIILFSLILFAINPCYAKVNGEEVINIQNVGHHGDHYNIPVPAEQPDVFYNNVAQTIIIDGTGEVEYYDVEIISLTTLDTVISTQVNGCHE